MWKKTTVPSHRMRRSAYIQVEVLRYQPQLELHLCIYLNNEVNIINLQPGSHKTSLPVLPIT